MFSSSQFLSLFVLGKVLGAQALAHPANSPYAVKERHVAPRAWSAVGDAPKSDTINLQIGLKQRNEGVVEQHLIEVSDPSHPRYGAHLTAAEINDIVSPADETIDLVHKWLLENGVSNMGYSPGKDWISIVTTIEKAEELLQTKYSKFQHRDGSIISRVQEWSLPIHLHEHIDVIQPTTSFFRPMPEFSQSWGTVVPKLDATSHPISWWEQTGKRKYGQYKPGSGSDAAEIAALCDIDFTTPDCLRTLYGTIDYTPKVPGKNKLAVTNYLNQTVNRPDEYQFLQNFRPEAASAAYKFEIVNINGAQDFQGPNLTEEQRADAVNIEGDLDGQLAVSIAWPTPLVAYLTGGSPPFIPSINTPTNTNEPYLTWLNYVLAQDDLPQVISTSYGEDEQTIPYAYAKRVCADFAKLGARGISVLFSSGDAGVGADGTCFSNVDPGREMFTPNFPAGCPWVTSVGATEDFLPEVTVKRYGSGAGFSDYFPAPAYQKKTMDKYIASLDGLYDGLYNKNGRGYPDVAAQGNHDAIVWGGIIRTVGGTSASSPTFAAVISLVNDALIAKGKKPLGFLNPWIYSGAYKALTDVTVGSSFGCNTSGFPAQEGWDAATGFGTPNFAKLVKAAFEKQ